MDYVDVLIVGAGPVGLIMALQLAKFGVSVRIIEKHRKSTQDAYGRAITLFPRTVEMLDQLGLAEELLRNCFACRDTVTYDSQGEEVSGRGWNFMNNMKGTVFDFALVLRQKFQEEIYRNALFEYGVAVETPIELLTAKVNHNIPVADYKVSAEIYSHSSGRYRTVMCRYLIGCDGGHSSVRRIFNIPFEGSISEDKWVRIDGQVKTDMPKPRSYCSIESPTHGNVLWAALDHGATRIGYAFTDNQANAYPKFDEAAAIKEAIAAVKPFNIEFERVDWWTIYTVGQRIAKDFFVHDCIFLAGDACHTHSSGAAQGVNTGIHDAVNLAWKLCLVLREAARPSLLKTYEAERRPNVEKLIQYDKDISRLINNRLPEKWEGDPGADVNVVLGQLLDEAGNFNSGLGISYGIRTDNPLNVKSLSYDLPPFPGTRGPDITLLRPGTFERTRLIRELPNEASFSILVFATDNTPAIPEEVHEGILFSPVLHNLTAKGRLKSITILPNRAPSPYEVLGRDPLGRAYFDDKDEKGGNAYLRYKIDPAEGAMVVLRPDGWIGTVVALRAGAAMELDQYFMDIFSDL
ncbi:FAD binding domain-containing protein [Hypomontagnella submonticulosa]|nr:FAD binding domain-containing protein [Hypomontagnella submonticulosa]